ncbi:MAG: CRTAC1 family protein, partial [Balneolaceae bacterium]
TSSNRQGIGARIEVVINDENGSRSVYRTVSTGGSFGANNSRAHVGIGTAEAIDQIIIKWPGADGKQIIENPDINRLHKISQS